MSGPKYFIKKKFSSRYHINKGGACDLDGGLRDPLPRREVRRQDELGKARDRAWHLVGAQEASSCPCPALFLGWPMAKCLEGIWLVAMTSEWKAHDVMEKAWLWSVTGLGF